MRVRPLILFAIVSAALTLTACETTQQTSKRLSKNAKQLATAEGVSVTRKNATIKVVGETVLHDQNGVAAIVELRNSGGAQAQVPIVIDVKGAKGKSLYTNGTPGLEPSLTSLPLIAAREQTFWVNDQIRTATKPDSVAAVVGAAKPAPGPTPKIVLGKPAFGKDTSGVFARAKIENLSKVPQKRLVVACISRRSDRIVAAGRAIVELLAPAPTKKPVTFRVYFIGNPSGGKLACAAPPTVLSGGR
ncbi:unannotated protein [freshwater metagenome]|uniref:Unannotated protein n=1 Tax=freshwater metagenome TaxID=449393 RepID=A0A6J7HFL8_9ZZZZ|nr:hypothetical protein [Actinomycetota bacterium]